MLTNNRLNTMFRTKSEIARLPKSTPARQKKAEERKRFEDLVQIADKYNNTEFDGDGRTNTVLLSGVTSRPKPPELDEMGVSSIDLETNKDGFVLQAYQETFSNNDVLLHTYTFDGQDVTKKVSGHTTELVREEDPRELFNGREWRRDEVPLESVITVI